MSAVQPCPPSPATPPAPDRLSVMDADFDELCRRHLCRHGQYGINVLHLMAVIGIYHSLMAITAHLLRLAGTGVPVVPLTAAFSIPYLAVLARNIPFRVLAGVIVCLVLLLAAVAATPGVPFWVHLLLILFWHRFQLWSHRRYTMHRDMSAFAEHYPKGPRLFVLLAVYELPLLLHYLLTESAGRSQESIHGEGSGSLFRR